jgi:hypothetical protein
MRLLASLLYEETKHHKLLAVLDVESEVLEKADEDQVNRSITGTIREKGPIWDEYFRFWSTGQPQEVDGHAYLIVHQLQVDHDLYSTPAAVCVEGDTIRLILAESFFGTVEEYRQELLERNQRVQATLDRWDRGDMIWNDVRASIGLKDDPRMNRPLTPEELAAQRQLYFKQNPDKARNSIG